MLVSKVISGLNVKVWIWSLRDAWFLVLVLVKGLFMRSTTVLSFQNFIGISMHCRRSNTERRPSCLRRHVISDESGLLETCPQSSAFVT